MTQEVESRMALKDLVDRYVAESDGNIKGVRYEKRSNVAYGCRTNRYGDSSADGIWNEDCGR